MSSPGRILVTLFMLLLFAVGICSAEDAPTEKTRFDYALSLYNQGAYDSALKEFKEYIKEFPKGTFTDDAMYWLGKYYMTNGQYEDGVEQFKAILAQFPGGDKAPQAQYEIAGYWYNPENPAHDYQKAMAEYLKIPFFYPDSHLVDDSKYYAALCQLEARQLPQGRGGVPRARWKRTRPPRSSRPRSISQALHTSSKAKPARHWMPFRRLRTNTRPACSQKGRRTL